MAGRLSSSRCSGDLDPLFFVPVGQSMPRFAGTPMERHWRERNSTRPQGSIPFRWTLYDRQHSATAEPTTASLLPLHTKLQINISPLRVSSFQFLCCACRLDLADTMPHAPLRGDPDGDPNGSCIAANRVTPCPLFGGPRWLNKSHTTDKTSK